MHSLFLPRMEPVARVARGDLQLSLLRDTLLYIYIYVLSNQEEAAEKEDEEEEEEEEGEVEMTITARRQQQQSDHVGSIIQSEHLPLVPAGEERPRR